jgi:hypothetical protein
MIVGRSCTGLAQLHDVVTSAARRTVTERLSEILCTGQAVVASVTHVDEGETRPRPRTASGTTSDRPPEILRPRILPDWRITTSRRQPEWKVLEEGQGCDSYRRKLMVALVPV